jgi:hypothetical protein
MSVSRQFTLLVAAFAIAMPASVGGLAYVMYSSLAAVHQVNAEGNRQTGLLFALIGSVGKVQSIEQRLLRQKDPDEIEKLLNESQAAAHDATEKILSAGADQSDVSRAFQALDQANQKSQQLLLHGEQALAQELFIAEANPEFEKLLASIGGLQQMMNRREEAATGAADAQSRRTQTAIFVVVGLIVAGLVTFGALMVRKVNTGLLQAVRELSQASGGTAAAAAQVCQGSQTLAEGASLQAASLEETAASSEEVSTMTRRNAENSRLAAERMKHAAGSVSEANGRLQQMIVSMNAIQASSDKVSKIIRTIDEIAFQTNILALNAAVEAARAGESGMGFAVVADEVRNLAHRSAEAARNTAVLIEESIANSKDGKSKLDQVSGAILSITKSADEVNRLVEEIRSGSEEQARGIEQVSRALANMQEATQTTAASAEESAAAGAELSAQSESMRETVRGLAQMVGGQAGL